MIDLRFVPLAKWPGDPTIERKLSSFDVAFSRILEDLNKELKHVDAQDVLIQAFLGRESIRNDGWPIKNARFLQPGIILRFIGRDRAQLAFPCDTYTDWQSNLRAISLTLTALRAVDRHGVSRRDEQYEGWKQSSVGATKPEPRSEKDWAIEHLAMLAQTTTQALRGNQKAIAIAYRSAVKLVHPDTPGGSVEAFHLLQTAMKNIR